MCVAGVEWLVGVERELEGGGGGGILTMAKSTGKPDVCCTGRERLVGVKE